MKSLFTLLLTCFVFAASAAETKFKRIEDVIYGRKFGTALTMDVFTPEKTNGLGVVFVVSGGWFSAKQAIKPAFCEPFLKRGYTVFAVVHGSQPRFKIPEIVEDMNRAVRYIRHNASTYGVDPNRIGVTGGSAGGHLSLMLGTMGGPGSAKAADVIDRESSAVQAVACFFPPTDFLNYGRKNTNGMGVGILKDFKAAFGELPATHEAVIKYGEQISPIYHITSNMPPTLLIHGDADFLVPIQQSETFVKKAQSLGATAKLEVKKGKAHGWPDWINDMNQCAEWFDQYLVGKKPEATGASAGGTK